MLEARQEMISQPALINITRDRARVILFRDGQSFSYVASFAEVEVDIETGKYDITDFLAVADVGVGLRSGAEGVGNVGLAHIADHARKHHRRHQQQRGREGRVLVRGAEEAQKSGHGRDIYVGTPDSARRGT